MIKRNKSEDLGEASIKFCINRKELLNTSPIEVVSCASSKFVNFLFSVLSVKQLTLYLYLNLRALL